MKVTYEFTEEDYVRLYKLSLSERYLEMDYQEWVLRLVMVSVCFSVFASFIKGSVVVLSALLFMLAISVIDFALVPLVARVKASSRVAHSFRHYRLGRQYVVEIAPEGITGWWPTGNGFSAWEAVRTITQDDHFVHISMYDTSGYAIPTRIFFQEAEVEKLFETARSYLEKSRSRWDNVADA